MAGVHAWGFATAGWHADAKLFGSLARASERRLADFTVQGLTNTAWAFATAGHHDASLFDAMAKVAQQRMREFNAQDVAHTAFAFAKVGQFDAELFSALARSARTHLERFSAQGLAITIPCAPRLSEDRSRAYQCELTKPLARMAHAWLTAWLKRGSV